MRVDGVAYDAHTMLRASRAISTGRGHSKESHGMFDLHCGNRWSSGGGEIDVLEYAQHMSLMDSVMFGEGFGDGGSSACINRRLQYGTRRWDAAELSFWVNKRYYHQHLRWYCAVSELYSGPVLYGDMRDDTSGRY